MPAFLDSKENVVLLHGAEIIAIAFEKLLEQVGHSHFIAYDAIVNAVCHSKRGDKGGDQ